MSSSARPVKDGARTETATALLRYGSEVCIRLDAASARQVMEAVGAHASRGGWVTVTDDDNLSWSFLVTPGVPIWIQDCPAEGPATR